MKPDADYDGCGLMLVEFVVVPLALIVMLVPIAVVALVLVPVELAIVVFAVLTGVVVELRLPDPSLAVRLVGGAIWVTGVFVLGAIFGPGPLLFGLIPVALAIVWWVLGTGSRRAAAADAGARRERTRRAAFRWSKVSSHGRSVAFDCWESPGSTYMWDFGDSSGADGTSPTHRYAEPGSYEVTRTVTGPRGSDSVTRTVSVP